MKQCNEPSCIRSVFSHGYCKIHGYLRTDNKAMGLKNVVSKTYNIPKSTIKAKFKAPSGQLSCFKEMWTEQPHVSELSGEKLLMFDVSNFHHILTKQAYPKFLLFKPNIILLTRNEHRMIHDHSFEDLIKKDSKWQVVADRYQQLKEMYNHG